MDHSSCASAISYTFGSTYFSVRIDVQRVLSKQTERLRVRRSHEPFSTALSHATFGNIYIRILGCRDRSMDCASSENVQVILPVCGLNIFLRNLFLRRRQYTHSTPVNIRPMCYSGLEIKSSLSGYACVFFVFTLYTPFCDPCTGILLYVRSDIKTKDDLGVTNSLRPA